MALASCRRKATPTPAPLSSARVHLPSRPAIDAAAPDATAPLAPIDAQPVVREETEVTVDGKKETWRLVWQVPPTLDCVAPKEWWTCVCNGFAFGESGVLDLVRVRADGSEDRLALGERTVQRWIPTKAESDAAMHTGLSEDGAESDGGLGMTREALAGHAVARIMKIGDYDHDGRATEFVFQVGAGPCWHRHAVLVGLERGRDELHVFVDEETEVDPDPSVPTDPEITLAPSDWELAKSGLPRTFTRVPCGDHGATEAELLTLTRGPKGLRAKRSTRRCP